MLVAVGTPSFSQVATTIGAADVRPYVDAYLAGLNEAFIFCGLVGVVGGVIAFLAFGQSDPLRTVWDNRDERSAREPSETAATA